MAAFRIFLLVGPKNRGAVGTESISRRRRRRGRKGMDRGCPLSSRLEVWGIVVRSPRGGSGAEPRPKTGFYRAMH